MAAPSSVSDGMEAAIRPNTAMSAPSINPAPRTNPSIFFSYSFFLGSESTSGAILAASPLISAGCQEGQGSDLRGLALLERFFIELGELVREKLRVLHRHRRLQPVCGQGIGKWLYDELGAMRSEPRLRQIILRVLTDGPLQALAGESGARHAAEDGGFRRADIIAVQAGDGEGLQDVEFDQFHGMMGCDNGAESDSGNDGEQAETEGFGASDAGGKRAAENSGVGDRQHALEFHGVVYAMRALALEIFAASGNGAQGFRLADGKPARQSLSHQPSDEFLALDDGDAAAVLGSLAIFFAANFSGGISQEAETEAALREEFLRDRFGLETIARAPIRPGRRFG